MSYVRLCFCCVLFFKQKTAYEMRISDWSSDVCSSDLCDPRLAQFGFDRRPAPFAAGQRAHPAEHALFGPPDEPDAPVAFDPVRDAMALRLRLLRGQIGRASCRERVWQYV